MEIKSGSETSKFAASKMKRYCLIFFCMTLLAGGCAQEEKPVWWKGNLHTHSLWSDGDAFPEVILNWYKENGYDFVALSDHNTLAAAQQWINVDKHAVYQLALNQYQSKFDSSWIEARTIDDSLHVRLKTFEEYKRHLETPGQFLVIQAEEITDHFEDKPVHMNATNLTAYIAPQGGGSVTEVMQRNLNAVLAQRERTGQPILPHLNHPNFLWGITVDDLLGVEGEHFFEVYNGHPAVNNEGDSLHQSTEVMWDILLTARARTGQPLMYGLATDDAHHYHATGLAYSNTGRGWIMVLADSLKPDALIMALEQGRFYATSGVEIKQLDQMPERLSFKIDGAEGVSYTTEFIGTRTGTDTPVGEVLARSEALEPVYTCSGGEWYVRARVKSTKPKQNPYREGEVETAWVQPIFCGKTDEPTN